MRNAGRWNREGRYLEPESGWAAKGCEVWSFADILPAYRGLEDWERGANEWHGAGGPLSVITAKSPHPTASAFLEAAREMGEGSELDGFYLSRWK